MEIRYRNCPICKAEMPSVAIKCRECGNSSLRSKVHSSSQSNAGNGVPYNKCSSCETKLNLGSKTCPNCGQTIEAGALQRFQEINNSDGRVDQYQERYISSLRGEVRVWRIIWLLSSFTAALWGIYALMLALLP